MRTFFSLSLVLSLSLAACGSSSGEEGFDTFQECYDDHATVESLPPAQAITICVLEHPIAGEHLMFGTSAECVAYVTANLEASSATTEQIQAGCDDYITQKGM